MSNLIPTGITDKNGKRTTVHKRAGQPVKASASRAAAAPTPPRAASAKPTNADTLRAWADQALPSEPGYSSGNSVYNAPRTNLESLESGEIHWSSHSDDIDHHETVRWEGDTIVVTRHESVRFHNIHSPVDFDDLDHEDGLETLASSGDWDSLAATLTHYNREDVAQNWDRPEFDSEDIEERLERVSQESGIARADLDKLVEFRGEISCGDADARDARSWWESSSRGQRWLDSLSESDRERFEAGEL